MYSYLCFNNYTGEIKIAAQKHQRAIMRRDGSSHGKSEKQARLPNTRITNKQKLEKVVAEISKRETGLSSALY